MKKYVLILVLTFTGLQLWAQTGLKKGDDAPVFSATDNAGKAVDLKALLKAHQSVLLFFYRGEWCPYCNKHIAQLQDSLQLLIAKGVYVIAVTPETKQGIDKTIRKTHASFSIVQDKGYFIMKSYKVNYVLDDATVAKYKGFGLDLNVSNGNTDHVLPVPATYLINPSGKIAFVHFNKDYTRRASVSDMMRAL
ncbi:alkyl hydroperoxide reductase/ Thiol specific antioxidant/ Mal allergen [Mucilaginibacter paludis DSM 18603]|uniref:thioredoxin-dependent peroxiredoxin n=2 Tax=Mucilaginibacter TaxID=423349 RepID=H1YE40_9SPHI|nr:alkyl hydroperoxide reductase/ Thiol specific antioxidant/ Mal allergen [Mucilaginibacter paludis DSM 18603]